MYKIDTEKGGMWFNEDKNYIKSLSFRSGKRVNAVCPFCEKERSLCYRDVTIAQGTSCNRCARMDSNYKSVVGKKFTRLTVMSKADLRRGEQHVLCACDCGNEIVVSVHSLKTGNTKSCGCYNLDVLKSRVGEFSSSYGKPGLRGADNPAYGKRGPLNPNYNKDISEEERKELVWQRKSLLTRDFRKVVKERDGNACIICDSQENLVVHHLNGFKDNPELRFEPSNGVTLCFTCHNHFHVTFMGGYKFSCTEADFNEFIAQI